MAMTDSALLTTIMDRVKRAERERLPLTSPRLAEELAVLDVPAWRVASAIYSLEDCRKIALDDDGLLRSTMPPPQRGRP